MKIALLGDIQANLPALEAVLNHAKSHGVTRFFNLGNSLGFNLFPDETIQRLKMENTVSILGHFDQRVLKAKTNLAKLKKSAAPDQWIFLNWIHDNLSADSIGYLNSLKESVLLTVGRKKILLTSRPPKLKNNDSGIPKKKIPGLLLKTSAEIVIFSRQQFPYHKKINHTHFINTGAIGYAFDTEIWACYTLLHFSFGFLRVRQYRLKYEVNRPQAKMNAPSPSITAAGTDLKSVEQLMLSCLNCKYAINHSRQVTRLALELFDQLQPLHKLADNERYLLQYGAMLHDIGWLRGQQGHHKTGFNIIINTVTLPFKRRERFIIALLALYHRKNTPDPHHLHFASLEPFDRRIVFYLAAILRIADAFDHSHQNLINKLLCRTTTKTIKIIYLAPQPAEDDSLVVLEKGRFLEEVFQRKLVVEWQTA